MYTRPESRYVAHEAHQEHAATSHQTFQDPRFDALADSLSELHKKVDGAFKTSTAEDPHFHDLANKIGRDIINASVEEHLHAFRASTSGKKSPSLFDELFRRIDKDTLAAGINLMMYRAMATQTKKN